MADLWVVTMVALLVPRWESSLAETTAPMTAGMMAGLLVYRTVAETASLMVE